MISDICEIGLFTAGKAGNIKFLIKLNPRINGITFAASYEKYKLYTMAATNFVKGK